MFLGRLSILELRAFIAGYSYALLVHKIQDDKEIFNFNGFNDFVAEYYKRPAQIGWALNIWAENYGDETQSFKHFFMLFDEFIEELKDSQFYDNLLMLYKGNLKQTDFVFP